MGGLPGQLDADFQALLQRSEAAQQVDDDNADNIRFADVERTEIRVPSHAHDASE